MSGKGSYLPSLLKWATLGLLLANVWTGIELTSVAAK